MSHSEPTITKKMWKCPICEQWFGDIDIFKFHTHTLKDIGDKWRNLIPPDHILVDHKQLEDMIELLSEIVEKSGAYSQDHLQHAENVIENASKRATKVTQYLKGLKTSVEIGKRVCPLYERVTFMDDNCKAAKCNGECHPNYGKGNSEGT